MVIGMNKRYRQLEKKRIKRTQKQRNKNFRKVRTARVYYK